MKVVRHPVELGTEIAAARAADRTVGFVPTMGALHEGHLSLVKLARERSDVVVVSIFVNPLQFGPSEDLQRYPRDEAGDLRLLGDKGTDVVFLPTVDDMYPPDRATTVSVGELAELVEGAARPGHFDGVATVVAKLLNLVQPTYAFFGQKDAQQVAVINKMVADLSIPVEVVVGPTVREADGLAMSSRNAYLQPTDRRQAIGLWNALGAGRSAVEAGDDWDRVEKLMWETLTAAGLEPDYAQAVDPDTFSRPHTGRPVLLVVAARAGTTRLIDNVLLDLED